LRRCNGRAAQQERLFERSVRAGADDQLDKPFSPAALGERVRRLLS
jgi:DNA-binding response OmpR family regulator